MLETCSSLGVSTENAGLHCESSLPQCLKGAGTPFDPTRTSYDPDIVRCLCRVIKGDGHVTVRSLT